MKSQIPNPKSRRRGEFDFINRLRQRLQHTPAQSSSNRLPHSSLIAHRSSLALGIGDDAAILNQNSKLQTLISADLLIEDIDFRRRWLPLKILARCLGHKALAVSISDIAAMGATARYCLTSIGLPADVWRTTFADEFYNSLLALAKVHNITLIGGDTSRTPAHIMIYSIVIGEIPSGRAVLRSGAQPGDRIFITGTLGAAAAGLQLLEAATRPLNFNPQATKQTARHALLNRQLRPTPRTAWSLLLRSRRLASAMIDISDGLSSDLHQLCLASNIGALLDSARLPIDPYIKAAQAALPNTDPLALALNGGEDYELLFTVPPAKLKRLPRELDGIHATEIGVVTKPTAGVKLQLDNRTRRLPARGFTHF